MTIGMFGKSLNTKLSQDFFQVCLVLGYSLRLDDHVVAINLNVSSDMLLENSVHQSLVSSACIF